MANPVATLGAAGALLAPGGAVLIGDEKAAETFTAPGDELERFILAGLDASQQIIIQGVIIIVAVALARNI